MPIYRKGNAWRVVVFTKGIRKDVVVRCSEEDAKSIERAMAAERIEASQDPEWRKEALRSRPSPFDDTYVYFIQAGENGPIKIGRADDVQSRLDGIQTANHEELRLLVYVIGDRIIEKRLHDKFSHLRLRGEWFKPGPDLLEAIAHLKAQP